MSLLRNFELRSSHEIIFNRDIYKSKQSKHMAMQTENNQGC